MNKESLLQLESVSKVYRTKRVETHALRDLSLTVGSGEFVTIVGPSGCGKSTLLSVLGLLEPVTSGRFLVSGVDTSSLSGTALARARNRTFGFIFQSFHLVPELHALDNVALVLQFRGMSKRLSRERAAEALASVGLHARTWHYPDQLSGGQQQRVAIARALVGDPDIILADEPTGNLDTKSGRDVLDLIGSLMDGTRSVLMVTHDPNVAKAGSRMISLMDGQLVSDQALGNWAA